MVMDSALLLWYAPTDIYAVRLEFEANRRDEGTTPAPRIPHTPYARGAFPLDVASSQPQVVSNWLEPRVPFHLTLPNYPEGGPKRYALPLAGRAPG